MPGVPEAAQVGLVAAFSAILGGGGVWTWLGARSKARADAPASMTGAQADLATALSASVEKLLNGYQEQCDRAAKRIDELETKSEERTRQIEILEARIDDLERENLTCQGENRDLKQWAGSLTRRLKEAGIDLTPAEMPGSFIELSAGQATVLSAPSRPASRPPR